MKNTEQKIKKWFKWNIYKPITSIILCIRFPFLYPRNRFTGLHYNNWKIIEKHKELYQKYHVFCSEEGAYLKYSNIKTIQEGALNMTTIYYLKKVGTKGWCEYWKNPWAKPYVKLLDFYHDWVLQLFHCIPTYDESGALKSEAPGWWKAFGIKLCKDIRKQLIKDSISEYKEIYKENGLFKAIFHIPIFFRFRIMQWKEKYGRMELYVNCASNGMYGLLDKYGEKSYHICYNCGKPAVYLTTPYGWQLPYCEKCFNDTHKTMQSVEWIAKDGEWIENPDFEEPNF